MFLEPGCADLLVSCSGYGEGSGGKIIVRNAEGMQVEEAPEAATK